MGGGNVKNCSLKKSELKEFQDMSYFSEELIITLYGHFTTFSALIKDDGVISYEEFLLLIGREDNFLSKKIFETFDTNKDNYINFREFLKLISSFITGSRQDQISLAFKFFADEESNLISRESMFNIIKDSIQKENGLGIYFDDDCINQMIFNTFDSLGISADENERESINYETFKSLMIKNDNILKWFKIDINKIKEYGNKIIRKASCS